MANPAPFPATAYDTDDWVQGVVLYQSGSGGGGATPIPYSAGGAPLANYWDAYPLIVTNPATTGNIFIGPNDGNTHELVAASLVLNVPILTVTGTAYVSLLLTDHAGSGAYLETQLFLNGTASADPQPNQIISMSWPGGAVITTQPHPTPQLQLVLDVDVIIGGTLLTWSAFGLVSLAWT